MIWEKIQAMQIPGDKERRVTFWVPCIIFLVAISKEIKFWVVGAENT